MSSSNTNSNRNDKVGPFIITLESAYDGLAERVIATLDQSGQSSLRHEIETPEGTASQTWTEPDPENPGRFTQLVANVVQPLVDRLGAVLATGDQAPPQALERGVKVGAANLTTDGPWELAQRVTTKHKAELRTANIEQVIEIGRKMGLSDEDADKLRAQYLDADGN